METKLTPLMQLINFILNERKQDDGSIKFHAHDDFSKFLQMEKKQMIDFAMQLHKIDMSKTGTDILINEAEQLYKNLYGK